MSLLELDRATKRFASGLREKVVLRDVSFGVDAGELVAVHGLRRSGRTTLLRVVAGMLALDAGEARFDGCDVRACAPRVLGVEIGYCDARFDPAHGGSVVDHVALAPLARGAGGRRARARAREALARVGASDCAPLAPYELRPDERVHVGIARAIVCRPRLLLLDEPTSGVDARERDAVLALLRSLAAEGVAVLTTVGEPVVGADRVLALEGATIRGPAEPEARPVVPLRPPRVEPVA